MNRETYQRCSSYTFIGKTVMNQNVIRKHVCKLEVQQLIRPEGTTITTKDDLNHSSNLLCTICPIQLVLSQFCKQQLAQMNKAVERQRVANALALCDDKAHST